MNPRHRAKQIRYVKQRFNHQNWIKFCSHSFCPRPMSALQGAREHYRKSKSRSGSKDSPANNTRRILSQAKLSNMSATDPEGKLQRMRENLLGLLPPKKTSISDDDDDFETSKVVPNDQTKLIRLDIKRSDKKVINHIDDVKNGLVAYTEELVEAKFQECQLMVGELDEKLDLKGKEAQIEVQKIRDENKMLRERIEALESLTDEKKLKEMVQNAVNEAIGKARKEFKQNDSNSKQLAPRARRDIQRDNHERAKADREIVIRNAKNDESDDTDQARQYLKRVATLQIDGQNFSRTWVSFAQWKGKSEPSEQTVLVAKFEDKRIRDDVLKMIPKEKKDGKNGNLFIRPGICASDRKLHSQIYQEFNDLKAQGKIKPEIEKPKIRGSNGYLYLCPSVKIGKNKSTGEVDTDEVGTLAKSFNETLNLNKATTSKAAKQKSGKSS